jgi:hypothetical protein
VSHHGVGHVIGDVGAPALAQLVDEDEVVNGGEALSAVLHGPAPAEQPRFPEFLPEGAAFGFQTQVLPVLPGDFLGQLLVEERGDFLLVGVLFLRVPEIPSHVCYLLSGFPSMAPDARSDVRPERR